jgi:hypothetical protein
MITFHNGPAHGVNLSLRRAPFFLRVTYCRDDGKDVFDALDQPLDQAAENENLFLYRIRPIRMGMAFIDGTRNGKRCGWSSIITEYEYVPLQPADSTMRDNDRWVKWCEAQSLRPKVSEIFEAWKKANEDRQL